MKIAIIGAGAAGCFAAANIAPREGLEVTVFEKTNQSISKNLLKDIEAIKAGTFTDEGNFVELPASAADADKSASSAQTKA